MYTCESIYIYISVYIWGFGSIGQKRPNSQSPSTRSIAMVGKGTPRRARAPLNAAPKWYNADRSQDVSFRSRCIQCGQLTWPSYESAFDETFKLPLFTDFCACARREDDNTCHSVCADWSDALLTLLLGDSTTVLSQQVASAGNHCTLQPIGHCVQTIMLVSCMAIALIGKRHADGHQMVANGT